jgi:hypothetical protein
MTRQEEKVNLQNGILYYEVTWKAQTAQLLPRDLYELIEEMIEQAIYKYEIKDDENR